MVCTYILVKVASGEIGFLSSFPSDELSYFKLQVIFMKNIPFAMAADDIANSTVVTVLVGLLLELDLYLVNTDK